MYNFNLEEEVRFDINIDLYDNGLSTDQETHLLEWQSFIVNKNEYKSENKILTFYDKENLHPLEIGVKIRRSEQTDFEIVFYAHNCIVNNTD